MAEKELARQQLQTKFKWETEAMKVINAKIEHYRKIGNTNKLRIYLLKKEAKRPLIAKVRNLLDAL